MYVHFRILDTYKIKDDATETLVESIMLRNTDKIKDCLEDADISVIEQVSSSSGMFRVEHDGSEIRIISTNDSELRCIAWIDDNPRSYEQDSYVERKKKKECECNLF